MKHTLTLFVVVSSVVGMLLVPAAVGTVVADHSEGDPPEDPGNNATEVPGIGRPACIPPQDPGHGQPACIPPSNPPGLGGDLPGNAPITPPGLGGDNPGNGNGQASTRDHSEGDPPEDPGNNATEVPGIGRPACIPPQDPGHGQPDCIPPSNPPGLGGDLPGNAPITPPGLGGDNPGNGGTTGGDAGPSSDTSSNQTIVDGVGDTLGL